MAIQVGPGINFGSGISIGFGAPPPPPAPAVTFGTPAIMNSGAFTSLLQSNSTDIDSAGLITVDVDTAFLNGFNYLREHLYQIRMMECTN